MRRYREYGQCWAKYQRKPVFNHNGARASSRRSACHLRAGRRSLAIAARVLSAQFSLQVVEGFDVLRTVEKVRCDAEDRPLDDVRISDSGIS
jgi:hypothetical protein